MLLSLALPMGLSSHAGACTGTVLTIKVAGNNVAYRDTRSHPNALGPQPRDVVYLESNGVVGLQSGGLDLTGNLGDPCFEASNHDQILLCRQGCHVL